MAYPAGTLIAGRIVTNPVGELLLAAAFTALAACYLTWDLRRLQAAESLIGPRRAEARRIVRHLGPCGVFIALMGVAGAWTAVNATVRLVA